MAAENNSNKIQEKGILYDLDIPYEWPETVKILNDNDYQSLYKILTAAVNACSWFALAVLRSPSRLLGLSSQPPSVLSDLLSSRLSWQLVLSSDGRQLAVVQESLIEIRSILDDFTTARASIRVSLDPYPQWRYSVWSPQGTSLAYADSQGHITVYSYNGDILYQLTGTGGVVLSRGSSERLPSFLNTAVSGMFFASNPADSASTLLIATSYDGQITTYSLRLRMSYTVLHSVSLLDYYPNGVGGVQYLSITDVIVIAGWSDDKDSPLVSCWRLINDSPYWTPANDNNIKKSKRGTFQSLVNKKVLNEMQDEFPELREVHALTERADHLEERHSYHSAREIYKDAVSKLLPLIEKTESPEKKKLLASEVQVFLQRGEELTILLEKKVPSYQRSSSSSSASSLKSTVSETCHVQ